MLYDLIVIGGGPAGYLACERAGHAGMSVLLIEKRALGGVCLNEGCIPTKTLLYSAKLYDNARTGAKYGVYAENVTLNHAEVIKRKNRVVKLLVSGVRAKMKGANVTVVNAEAVIEGRAAEGFNVRAGGEVYTAKRILIATGSTPVIPPIPGLREGIERGYVLTNREILDIGELPRSLVIVGGGVIGLEMAAYFNSAGSRVTVIEMLDKIAGPTDGEISAMLLSEYKKKGVSFELGAKVSAIEDGAVVFERGGETHRVDAERVLLSIGRRAASDGLGLESIGVETLRGAVKTDEQGRTNIPGVYAAGDVNGRSMLAHTAYREAEVCVSHMTGKRDAMRYDAIPAVIYTNPEVAGVGETEESASAKGLDFEIKKLSMRFNGRFLAENEGGDGLCKLLLEKGSGKLIGVHLLGAYASETIYGAAIMLHTVLHIDDIKKLVFPHPAVAEIIRETVF